LDSFKRDWPEIPEKELETDFFQFLLLLDELDLVEIR
jgi:hypothetical protein